MKNKIRKAFTLVELLVVIAIIAVLAVVGIVSYSAFTKKAELSNDVGLITQINTVLQADEAGEGKNKTFHDVRADVLENGIDLAKINLSSKDFRLAWDSEQDRVVLLDGDKVAVAPDDYVGQTEADMKEMFIVAKNSDNVTAETVFNFYLPDDFTVPAENKLTVKVGIDVGNHVNLDIDYEATGTETRIFNTNGGTLTVNNPQSTIEHYGSANKAVITATAAESYHCHAIIAGSIDVAQGHVVVENNAEVPLINVVKSENAEAKVKVDYQPEAKQDIPVMVAEGVNSENLTVPQTTNQLDVSVFTSEEKVAISNASSNKYMKLYKDTGYFAWGENNLLGALNCPSNTEITLLKDATYSGHVGNVGSDTAATNIVFNLNGHTLTLNSVQAYFNLQNNTSGTNSTFTVKNGTIKAGNNIDKNLNLFVVCEHRSVILDNVKIDSGTKKVSTVFIKGNGASVTVKNSELSSNTFCISTNAGTSANWDVEIEMENSVLTSTQTALMLNVPGKLDAKNCTISGAAQAAFIRGGTASFTNCTLINTGDGTSDAYDNGGKWGTGNGANHAALTLGNRSEAAGYQNPVTVTLTGCTLSVESDAYPALYAWANNGNGEGVTLTYSDCTFNGKVLAGGQAVEGLGNGLDHLRVNNNTYQDSQASSGPIDLLG